MASVSGWRRWGSHMSQAEPLTTDLNLESRVMWSQNGGRWRLAGGFRKSVSILNPCRHPSFCLFWGHCFSLDSVTHSIFSRFLFLSQNWFLLLANKELGQVQGLHKGSLLLYTGTNHFIFSCLSYTLPNSCMLRTSPRVETRVRQRWCLECKI